MAILSKIRKLPIIIIILIIGLPLLTFVADPSALTDLFSSSRNVGQVDGEDITMQEFQTELNLYKNSNVGLAKSVYNSMVRTKVYEKQLAESGITIGETDIFERLCQQYKDQSEFQTAGVFDREKLKVRLATIKQTQPDYWTKLKEQNFKQIEKSLLFSTYDDLASSGMGASLLEGEIKYKTENSKLSADYVYIPFSSVKDSTVKVTADEIKAYLDENKSDYLVDASRDLKFVKFDVTPSKKDEDSLRNTLNSLVKDRLEYNESAKTELTIKGFASTTNYTEFFADNNSDVDLDQKLYFKNTLPTQISQKVINGTKGTVFAPYKDKELYKLVKLADVVSIPDSVKARHILIPFAKGPEDKVKLTKVEAKKLADSLLTIVKADTSKFEELAKKNSTDGSASKGGDLGWFGYSSMVKPFRDYCFNNKVGEQGIVESKFGFHVIKIDNQQGAKQAYRLVVFGRKIEALKETQDKVYDDAQAFEESLEGNSIDDLAKEKSLKVEVAQGVEALSSNVPGLGEQRKVVIWAFDQDTKVGDVKRFAIDNNSFAVVTVTEKIAKGLMPVKRAVPKVRPILLKEKKIALIKNKLTAENLADLAKANNVKVRKFSDVSLNAPTISGLGYEPNVIGALSLAKEGLLINPVVGNKGVFALKLTKRVQAVKLDNYDIERKRIENKRKNASGLYEAMKKSSNVVDNLSAFYGIKE